MFRRILSASLQAPCRRQIVTAPAKTPEEAWHLAGAKDTFDTKHYSTTGHIKIVHAIQICVYVPSAVALYIYNFYIHPHPLERFEYKEYEHIYIRRRPFPWGDGKRGLFHHPAVNAVPGEGYEQDLPEGGIEHGMYDN